MCASDDAVVARRHCTVLSSRAARDGEAPPEEEILEEEAGLGFDGRGGVGVLTVIVWYSRWHGYPDDGDTDAVALQWLACAFDVGDGRDCITVWAEVGLGAVLFFSLSLYPTEPHFCLVFSVFSFSPSPAFSSLAGFNTFGGTYRRVMGCDIARLGSLKP